MSRHLDVNRLAAENRRHRTRGGVSEMVQSKGLLPAFRDSDTGRVEISRFRNGRPAPIHVIEGLPEEWAIEHDSRGGISALKGAIVSGFVFGSTFYTRDQAARF